MKFNLPNNITRSIHKIGFTLKKHSPEILLVAGVVGTVASAVMACKATTKVSTILEETKNNLDDIHNYVETNGYSERYTEQDHKKDTAIVYTQTAVEMVKLYAPAVALGALSIASILTSHKILRGRNLAIAAAYATIDKGFKEYRGRVIDRFGKELDRELRYDIKSQEVQDVIVNEDGSETTVTNTVQVATVNEPSDYARFFCEGNTGWEKDAEHNLYFLRCQERYANELLQSRGHLFLNEVYDMLGIPRSSVGQQVGWIYDEKHPVGDNYVDFGIYDLNDERKREFVNGRERNILLDFNVDGNILGYMS
jgi:hypothetical protein